MTQKLTVSSNDLQRQFEAIEDRAQALVTGLSDDQLSWSPAEGRWSIAQCLEHLCIVGEGYGAAIDGAITQARAAGWTGDGVSRPGPLERWFISRMEPTSKGRMKAPGSMRPSSHPAIPGLPERFQKLQESLKAAAAEDLDVNRTTLRSPFFRVLKLRLGATLQMNAAHERRHLAQAENVRRAEGFPGGSP